MQRMRRNHAFRQRQNYAGVPLLWQPGTACINAGFNKDYIRQDTYFYGYDNQGNHLAVEYRGYNIVEISVYAESN